MTHRTKPMLGLRFGRSLVIAQEAKKGELAMWRCMCDCGREFVTSGSALRLGKCRSCGCLKGAAPRHGMTGTPTYISWVGLLSRCRGSGNPKYAYVYVDRNISYAPEWAVFENFFRDMGQRPAGTTLDRIDNDLGYSKENCRWATPKEQRRNQRNVEQYEWAGQLYFVPELCREHGGGQSISTFHARIKRYGWSLERTLTTPVRKTTKGP